MKTGYVSGLLFEARAVVGKAAVAGEAVTHPSGLTYVYLAGIGPERATAAARALVEKGVEALISWGTCAGLQADIPSGALMMPQELHGANGQVLEANFRLRKVVVERIIRLADVREVPMAEATQVLGSTEAKTRLGEQTRASAADMESMAVARVAAEAGLPFVAMRAVIDPVHQALPPEVLELSDAYGKIRWVKVPSRALSHGRTLLHLAKQSHTATQTLTRVAFPVRKQLEEWVLSG